MTLHACVQTQTHMQNWRAAPKKCMIEKITLRPLVLYDAE